MKLKVKRSVRVDLTNLSAHQAMAIKIALGKSKGNDYETTELNDAADEVYDMLHEQLSDKILEVNGAD